MELNLIRQVITLNSSLDTETTTPVYGRLSNAAVGGTEINANNSSAWTKTPTASLATTEPQYREPTRKCYQAPTLSGLNGKKTSYTSTCAKKQGMDLHWYIASLKKIFTWQTKRRFSWILATTTVRWDTILLEWPYRLPFTSNHSKTPSTKDSSRCTRRRLKIKLHKIFGSSNQVRTRTEGWAFK